MVLCFVLARQTDRPGHAKLDLTANPLRFLARCADLWNNVPEPQNQAYGYLFYGAFFLLGHPSGCQAGVIQRCGGRCLPKPASGACCGSPDTGPRHPDIAS